MPAVNPGPSITATNNLSALYGSPIQLTADMSPSYSASANSSNLQKLINQLSAAGGGLINIEAYNSPIPVASTIVLANNVAIRGAGWSALLNVGTQRVIPGTVLQGDGTFPIFSFNPNDSNTGYATSAAYLSACVSHAEISYIGLDTCTYGIKIGALNQAGAIYCRFANIYISNHSQWGIFEENSTCCEYEDIYVQGAASGNVGMMYFGASLGTVWNPGNSTYKRLFCQKTSVNSRNIVFNVRAGGTSSAQPSTFNDLNVFDVQGNGNGIYTTATCNSDGAGLLSFTAGNIANFPVDMPVTVSASFAGLVSSQTYFVTVNNGTKITLQNYQGDLTSTTPVTPSQTGIALVTYGPAGLEMVGYGTSAFGNKIESGCVYGADIELVGTTGCFVQNSRVQVNVNNITSGTNTSAAQAAGGFAAAFGASSYVGRNWQGALTSLTPGNVLDLDGNTTSNLLALGVCLHSGNISNPYLQSHLLGGVMFDVKPSGTNQGAGFNFGGPNAFSSSLQMQMVGTVTSGQPYDTFNFIPIVPSFTVGGLPSPSTAGAKCIVTNSNATMTAGIGAVVAAGGTNVVPVYYDGTNWRIG